MAALDQINQGGTIYEIVPEIAELFKTTKAYHIGDHVIYEAGWYTFKADKSAGAWDATKVDGPFKVTNELSSLKSDLNEYETIFTDNVDESVQNWLDEHPEATTTVQDGSITYKKLLTGTLGYVTPQMYGAKGDGSTDDTRAIQDAINSGYNVFFPKATYVCDTINITGNNLIINGGNSTLLFGDQTGFILSTSVHDVVICNINSICEFEKDSESDGNIHIGIESGITNEKFVTYNIYVYNCNFIGGIGGVSATSVKNITIENCNFYDFVYVAPNEAWGYGILLSSCIDVTIQNCDFKMGAYGRHDIYVSVDRRKNENIQDENVSILNCKFDHSNLVKDESGYYYSPGTSPITVRTSNHVNVSGCYFYSVVCAVTATAVDGIVNDLKVTNCMIDSPVYNAGEGEARSIINCIGTSNYPISGTVNGVTLINVPSNYATFATLTYCHFQFSDCDIKATRFVLNSGIIIQISKIITDIPYYFIRFYGTDKTLGSCRNIVFTNANITSTNKYQFDSGASCSDDFFKERNTALITGNTNSAAGYCEYIPFPDGYDTSNTIISGFNVYYGGWRTGQMLSTSGTRMFATFDNSGIRVYNDDSSFFDKSFRILLTKTN